MNYIKKILFVIIFALAGGNSLYAQGGPPMLIDDPVTVEKGHWEINNAFILEHTANSDAFELPLEDFNYGLTDNIHLKYEVPLVFKRSDGTPLIGGLGKSSFGAKWRFFEDEKSKISISAFPAVSFNILTSSSERGITDEGVEFVLPVSFMIERNSHSFVFELGRQFSTRNQGSWIFGSLYNIGLSKKAELAAELFGNSDYRFMNREVFLNIGTRFKLSKHFTLLISAGDNFILHEAGENALIGYAGLQLAL